MSTTADLGATGRGQHAQDADRAPGGAPVRGLLWLVWRQHRVAFVVLLALMVAGGVYMAVLRGRMSGFLDSHHIAGCSLISLDPHCAGTQNAVDAFRASYGSQLRLAEMLLMALPFLVGIFIGAPLLARELESGTHKLVLTQSVGPLRWLAAKIALPAAAAVVTSAALAAVFMWLWQVGGEEVSGSYWYSTTAYGSLGPVPVAQCLLGLAVGTLAGLLLRRTVVSMAVTLGVMGAVSLALQQLRPYLMAPTTVVFRGNESQQLKDTSWFLEQGHLTGTGSRMPTGLCAADPSYESCLRSHNVVASYVDQHPVSHHWQLAWTESGIVLVLAVVATVIAFRVMKRRHG
ncbi:ABC transporter permease subunit [Streptomyces pinistramenti]|uniref:ABC transporter permease subunit n=1 Tax=Streptomyces pinistramenti TaxID=2884812 RepID=UPI001D05E5A4|nr:ABC transporter permease subunit [Streptomyces pinistramenti]MCB5912173.1 ABC transporter permease subunit [Streptomyces pinistramenti]